MSIKDAIHYAIDKQYPSHEAVCDICEKKKKVRDFRVYTENNYLVTESEKLCKKCTSKLLNSGFLITYLPVSVSKAVHDINAQAAHEAQFKKGE